MPTKIAFVKVTVEFLPEGWTAPAAASDEIHLSAEDDPILIASRMAARLGRGVSETVDRVVKEWAEEDRT